MTGLLLFGSFLLLLLISTPIAMSLGIASSVTILFSDAVNVGLNVIPQRIFGGLDSTSILAIPFFILAGNLMTKGGISERLVHLANSVVGGFRGGMALALVLACAFFSALSGSAPATVIAIGAMLYPDMVKLGYPKDRTAGLLVTSGGLGPIIPPSIVMVVYGTLTSTSIGNLFTAGMVVGGLLMTVLMVSVVILAHKEGWPKSDKKMSGREILTSFLSAIPALLLPIIILGGIYSGLLTPTESAAIAVVWALFVGTCIYKEITLTNLIAIIIDSAKSSAMLLFIIATSSSFAWIFSYSGISGSLVSAIVSMELGPELFIFIIAIVLLVFGIFLEGIATVVLLVPVLWPIANALGIDPVHFGMVVVISNVIGTMTPPVAVNIFACSSVTKLPMGDIAKGQLPFFVAFVMVFFLVVFVPELSTFLVS
ncbi:TRAP transporter large permease [Vibrio sp. E150_011]